MGAAGRAWFPSHFSSIMLAGYGCLGMGHASFLASEVERERAGENDLKSSTCAVKKKLHSAVQNGTVQVFFFFFFEEKEKN